MVFIMNTIHSSLKTFPTTFELLRDRAGFLLDSFQ